MAGKTSIAADAVVLKGDNVLLIKRGREPFKGRWALPGGFLEYKETLESCVVREVKEETGLDVRPVRLTGVYSKPDRDPRGHTVSAVYLCEVSGGILKGGDDASEARWWPVDGLPGLAFDHGDILGDALP